MKSINVQPNGETAEEPTLDDATINNLATRIAKRQWRVEDNRLRTTIIDTTPNYGPIGCGPVGVLALDAPPNRLREILNDPEHASVGTTIKDMQADWLKQCLEERHWVSFDPGPNDDLFLRISSALAIHEDPVTEFTSAVTGLDLPTIELITHASEHMKTLDGNKLIKAVARARTQTELATDQ